MCDITSVNYIALFQKWRCYDSCFLVIILADSVKIYYILVFPKLSLLSKCSEIMYVKS